MAAIWMLGLTSLKASATGNEETSTASVSFLPNPELPLPPDPGPNEDPIGTDNGHFTGSLPQTGEKELSPLIGLIVTLAVLIIWYFRRKLLRNKIQTHIGGN